MSKAELSEEAIQKRIEAHRTAQVALNVTDAAGRPLARAPITIRQRRHKFLFGCNVFMLGRCGDDALEREYRSLFSGLFNYATLPFYWQRYEPTEGEINREYLRTMAHWCREMRILTKGHP